MHLTLCVLGIWPPKYINCGHTWFADPEKTTNIGDGQLTYKSKIPQAVWRIPTLIRTPTVDESFLKQLP